MYLSLLTLNLENPQARKDLADPYAMHQTLARAAEAGDRLLWRLEERRGLEAPRVLVQTLKPPHWSWLLDWIDPYGDLHPTSPKHVRLSLYPGQRLRFRLYANPTVTKNGKRLGLYREEEQLGWLQSRLEKAGARLKNVVVSRRARRTFKKHDHVIVLATAQFDGLLEVQDPGSLVNAVETGLGHGKAFGLGLLSLAPY